MTLLINNDVVAQVLKMPEAIEALESAYRQHVMGQAVCRPRVDIQIDRPEGEKADGVYQWGTMEGGSQHGYFAIRMKSDIIYEQRRGEVITQEKFCKEPGLYCGLIFLTSTLNGEPLALINDGVLQHVRVGADGGIGVKVMSRPDSAVLGMLGSGGMARTHMDAIMAVRDIKRLQVYSPTPQNRERFGDEMRERFGIEVAVCGNPRDIYRDADIVAGVTDSAVPVLNGEWLEPGTHIVNVGGGGGRPDQASLDRVDRYLRFGNASAPWGLPDMALDDEYLTYSTEGAQKSNVKMKHRGERGHGASLPDRMITLKEIFIDGEPARTRDDEITYSERGNLQGLQFWSVGALVYERAKAEGLGHELPTEWFLQDIRD